MSIDDKIKQHIIAGMATAYPSLDEDQVIVIMADGKADYEQSRGRDVIGTEVLLVEVVVNSDDKLDRLPFWRQFRRRNLDLGDGDRAMQIYKGHRFRDFTDITGFKGVAFRIEYTTTIYEQSS